MEPIFIFILIGFIGFALWYFWPRRQKETIAPIPHVPPDTPPKEFKYNLVGRVSKPITLNWNRESIGCETPHNDFELKIRCQKKINDLSLLLAKHGKDGFELAPNDLIRYNAMIEVLKAMIN